MNELLILASMAVGVLLWRLFMWPWQLREHERKRRRYGLPPERRLPEDRKSLDQIAEDMYYEQADRDGCDHPPQWRGM